MHTLTNVRTYVQTCFTSVYTKAWPFTYTYPGYSCQAPLMHATISYCSVSYAWHVQHEIPEHSLIPKLGQWGQASTVSHMPVHCNSAPLTMD